MTKSADLLRIWSHLLKKSLMENFNFCAVSSDFFFFYLLPDPSFYLHKYLFLYQNEIKHFFYKQHFSK